MKRLTNEPDARFTGGSIEATDVLARVKIPGEPITKARARFTRRGGVPHVYTPRATIEGEARYRDHLALAVRQPSSDPVGVRVVFACRGRQRADLDNMLKALLDAANHIVWDDDALVTEIVAIKLQDQDDPHVDALFYRGHDSRRRCEA